MRIAAAFLLSTLTCCRAGPETPKPAAATVTLPTTEVTAVAAKVKARYDKGSKYMEGRDLGLVEIPDWKGFPTHKWEYAQTDRDGTRRPATVIMLNPSPDQFARWIVRASYDLKQKYDTAFCDALLKHVFVCSGGQFVVRGICLEDMDGDGIHTAYPFRDGVTVKVRGIPGYPNRPLTEAESNAALNAPVSGITQFAKRARLQSTQPAEWAKFSGTAAVEGAAWLTLVREQYQKAWGSDSNPMLTATAKALGLAAQTTAEKRARLEVLESELRKVRQEVEALGINGCADSWPTVSLNKIKQSLTTENDPVKVAELKENRIKLLEWAAAAEKTLGKLKALDAEKARLDSEMENAQPPVKKSKAAPEGPFAPPSKN
jgi:hypothetical protein